MRPNEVSPVSRFALLLVISIALMIIDHRSRILKPVRSLTSVINIPLESIAGIPSTISGFLENYYPDDSLVEEYKELQERHALLETRLQRYDSLLLENQRLAKLLSASKRTRDDVLLTEIIDSGVGPQTHKIVVNRGIESGVFLGQPAIAPDGVLGQVSEVGYRRSVITLITNSTHGLPVQIQRNGLRTIIQGTGKSDQVRVPFLASQADIQQGDLLVTSGMGGRFPVGYYVAEVTGIVKDANEAFLNVTATTTARIDYTKEVLLLWGTESNGDTPHQEQD